MEAVNPKCYNAKSYNGHCRSHRGYSSIHENQQINHHYENTYCHYQHYTLEVGTSQYCSTSFRFLRRCCFHCIFIKSAPHHQCTALTGENTFYNQILDSYISWVGAGAEGNPADAAAWTSPVLGKWIKPFDAAFHTAPQKNVKVVSNEIVQDTQSLRIQPKHVWLPHNDIWSWLMWSSKN